MIELKFKDGRKLDVKYPIILKDSRNNIVYFQWSDGVWIKSEYDSQYNKIYFETSEGSWARCTYDEDNNLIYDEDSDGNWHKCEYDKDGIETYFENSEGVKKGTSKHEVVEMTMEEICKSIGKNVKVIK